MTLLWPLDLPLPMCVREKGKDDDSCVHASDVRLLSPMMEDAIMTFVTVALQFKMCFFLSLSQHLEGGGGEKMPKGILSIPWG